MPLILDGKIAQKAIAEKLSAEILNLGNKPTLFVIQVGDREDSNRFIKRKIAFGEKIGARVEHLTFSETVSEKEILEKITELNGDKSVNGIIVQLPLPENFNKEKIITSVASEKDVDGLAGSEFIPAAARAVFGLLEYYEIPVAGKKTVVIGRSDLVGKPIALLFSKHGAIVSVCHTETRDIKKETNTAEILIVAAGSPHLVKEDFVSDGVVVVDVGINVLAGEPDIAQKLVGDVDFNTVAPKCFAISPVPGGVGPLTVAYLFENLLKAYKMQN